MPDTLLGAVISSFPFVGSMTCESLNQGERQTLPGHPECSGDKLSENVLLMAEECT